MKKKCLALVMVCMLLCSGTALAQGVKRERVFGVLSADGTAQMVIDSVVLENADEQAEIKDRSELTDIENVRDDRGFRRDGDTVIWSAKGEDVYYQGKSERQLPVTPVISCTLDASPISMEALQGATGELKITVEYQSGEERPFLALSALVLSNDRCADVRVENAVLLDDGSRKLVVGYGVTGCTEVAELPTGFTVTAKVTDFSCDELMTLVTSDPMNAARDALQPAYEDALRLTDDAQNAVSALKGEKEADNEKVKQVIALLDGARQLSQGAAELQAGLNTLTQKNDALNTAASTVMDTLLSIANQQLSTLMPELPALTQENYEPILSQQLDALSEEGIRQQAAQQARQQVAQKVKTKENDIRAEVQKTVEKQVLQGVLDAAGVSMSAEEYDKAVKADRIPREQSAQISAAVEQQLAAPDVQAKLDAAVQEQEEKLIEENMASKDMQTALDQQLKDVLTQAAAGREQLAVLKSQLDQYAQFQQGLKQYTDGVTQAQQGCEQLSGGAKQISEGLQAASESVAETLTRLLGDDLRPMLEKYDAVSKRMANNASFDLVAEGMDHTLTFILRSEWK